MNEFASDYKSQCIDSGCKCKCSSIKQGNDDLNGYPYGNTEVVVSVEWNMTCSDFGTLYSLFVAVLVMYIILAVTSFTASIFGCRGTCHCHCDCCVPVNQYMVATDGCHTGGTVVVSSNQTSMMHSGCPG
ncbi:Hypothetical predicted protein [Paramuricea clavata]|uniref:Uncharacterized protein n=2 Tax=Paramuricea clavata TaxID=317549 RepID=A0A6S7HDG2_PARCT|nr:Hypothetical predicted protein [Paramuricea clavata]